MLRRRTFWGPLSALGVAVAVFAYAGDQAHKWWMLSVLDIAATGPITVAPFFDLVMVWNRGVSYGLFQQDSGLGLFVLAAFPFVVAGGLLLWLATATRALLAFALGLVIGGALGNATDRIVHGAVADFFSFHAYGYHWYVFNLADVAIVAGVAILLYDSLNDMRSGRAGNSSS